MKLIKWDTIVKEVSKMCISASCDLPEDVYKYLLDSIEKETSHLGKSVLHKLIENADIAKINQIPLCQDTGAAVFFVEIGDEVKIKGGTIYDAINEGTRHGYTHGYLRKSIVDDPVFNRTNTNANTPAIIYVDIVQGDILKIVLGPKGAGSENMSALAMLTPSAGRKGIIDFVVNTVVKADANPCPPIVVGVGIGGNFEYAAYLAKKALFADMNSHNADENYKNMEIEILDKINASGIGPGGFGGSVSAMSVHILTYPCHIASLPVAVNINCNAARHTSIIL